MQVDGGLCYVPKQYQFTGTSYTATINDHIIFVDSTITTPFTVNLPDTSTIRGSAFIIINASGHNITIAAQNLSLIYKFGAPTGAFSINLPLDGTSTYYSSITLWESGSGFYQIA